jgi:hypothetical protein
MNLKEKNVIIRNKMPLNYQNAVIYKICCKDPTIKDIYVGSTTNFKRRMSNHKSICNSENANQYNYPVYRFIRDNGGFNNWTIVKIRDVVCKDKYELVAEERKEFEKLGATLNDRYPQRSRKEVNKTHYEKNKEKISEKQKEYKEKNKEKISNQNKENVKCECGSVVTKVNLSRHKKTQKHQNWEKTLQDN